MRTCTVHVFTLDCSITIAVTTTIVESHHRLAYPPVQDTVNNDAFHRYGRLCGYSHFENLATTLKRSPALKFTTSQILTKVSAVSAPYSVVGHQIYFPVSHSHFRVFLM